MEKRLISAHVLFMAILLVFAFASSGAWAKGAKIDGWKSFVYPESAASVQMPAGPKKTSEDSPIYVSEDQDGLYFIVVNESNSPDDEKDISKEFLEGIADKATKMQRIGDLKGSGWTGTEYKANDGSVNALVAHDKAYRSVVCMASSAPISNATKYFKTLKLDDKSLVASATDKWEWFTPDKSTTAVLMPPNVSDGWVGKKHQSAKDILKAVVRSMSSDTTGVYLLRVDKVCIKPLGDYIKAMEKDLSKDPGLKDFKKVKERSGDGWKGLEYTAHCTLDNQEVDFACLFARSADEKSCMTLLTTAQPVFKDNYFDSLKRTNEESGAETPADSAPNKKASPMQGILLAIGLVVLAVGHIWLIVQGFRTKIIWGISLIFLSGIASLLFLGFHPGKAGKPFIVIVVGVVIVIISLFL